jgi:cytochrome P450
MYHVICGRALTLFNISGLHPRHKIYRRILHSGLSAQGVQEYSHILEDEADILIQGLRETPTQFKNHL